MKASQIKAVRTEYVTPLLSGYNDLPLAGKVSDRRSPAFLL